MSPAITLANLWTGDRGERYLPLGLLWLRASLEQAGMEVEIRDLQGLPSQLREAPALLAERLDDSHPVLGLSLMADAMPLAVALTRELRRRRPTRRVILGGPGPSAVAAPLLQAFPCLDLVVRGEGERTLVELMRALPAGQERRVPGVSGRDADGPFHAPDRALVDDLDALPSPRLGGLEPDVPYVHATSTSRGCPFGCRFCSLAAHRRVRRRSVDSVVRELSAAQRRHGVRAVTFQDDVFLHSRSWVEALLDGLDAAGVSMRWDALARPGHVDPDWLARLAERGMRSVAFGIEAGSDTMLERMGKGHTIQRALRAVDSALHHLRVRCFFLWGFPDESLEDFLATAHAFFHVKILGALPEMGHLVPLAGSSLLRDWRGPLEAHRAYPFTRLVAPPRDPALWQMVLDHPEVFPAHHAFPTLEREAKWAMAAKAWPTEG